jgi:hypothetical protein
MAVRRKPLSATVVATLKRKAKASKKYTYGSRKHDLDLRKKKK